jgi:hypothetical protein
VRIIAVYVGPHIWAWRLERPCRSGDPAPSHGPRVGSWELVLCPRFPVNGSDIGCGPEPTAGVHGCSVCPRRGRSAHRLGCPRVAAFLARYLYSHHVEDRLLPLKTDGSPPQSASRGRICHSWINLGNLDGLPSALRRHADPWRRGRARRGRRRDRQRLPPAPPAGVDPRGGEAVGGAADHDWRQMWRQDQPAYRPERRNRR